jgi:hypothetical protein
MSHGTQLLRKIGWTLLAGFVSFTGSGLLDNVLHVGLADQLILTIVVGGVTLIVQYLADVERRMDESDRLHRRMIEDLDGLVRRGFESVNEATELLSEIEQSTDRRDHIKQVIRRLATISPFAPALVQSLADSELARLAVTLKSLSDGHEVFYDGEDREYLLALAHGATKSILATSWATTNHHDVGFEAGFWLSDLGARYLDLQRAAVRGGVVIQRVFVVESPSLMANPELGRILTMQRGAGIQVRLISGEDVAQDGGLSDFVIFDEQVCYDTTPVTRSETPGAPWRLTTRLVLNEETVRQRLERFRELWAKPLLASQADPSENGAAVVPGPKSFGSP